jgi:hypothetical protein
MPTTSTRMVIINSMMTRSKAPRAYINQSGVVGDWAGAGGSGGSGGSGGVGGTGVGSTGGEAGNSVGAGTTADGDADGGAEELWGDSVVKVPTALQALRVLELMALTFQ